MFWLTLLAFVIILGLLVFVHEFGHFIVAKFSGVKVEEFAFGFPPRIICKKRGETRYSINAIPFGGYVKMLGEEEKVANPRSFSQKKPQFRLAIVVAGVLMNFILAGILFSVGYMIGMSPIRLDPEKLGGQRHFEVLVADVLDNSPAKSAGLQSGDSILGFSSSEDFSQFTHDNVGKPVEFTVKSALEARKVSLTLSANTDSPLGIGVVSVPTVKLPFFAAIYRGFQDMILTTGYIVVLLFNLIVGIFKERKVAGEVAGPVGIFNLTGQAVRLGLAYLIQLAAILSINLGLINILPLPALDGGRGIVIAAEGVFRKKVIREELENLIHTIGFVILILLISAITIKEIVGLIK